MSTFEFFSRETEIKSFEEYVENFENSNPPVLYYYGLSGMGRSKLKENLTVIAHAGNKHNVSSNIDYEEPELNSFSRDWKSLVVIRKDLGNQGIRFPLFDAAYTHYYEIQRPRFDPDNYKSHADTWLASQSIIEIIKDFKEAFEKNTSVFQTLLSVTAITSFDSVINAVLSGGAVILKIINTIKPYLDKNKKYAAILDSFDLLQNYAMLSIENNQEDLIDGLITFLTIDINNYLEQNQDKSIIIFIDSYEKVFSHSHTPFLDDINDNFLRNLIHNLPIVKWVVFGDMQRKWIHRETDSVFSHTIIKRKDKKISLLSNSKMKLHLSKKIKQKNIVDYIAEESGGFPWLYHELSKKYSNKSYSRTLLTERDLALNSLEHELIIEKYLGNYVKSPERQVLNLLSMCSTWTEIVFRDLVNEFKPGISPESHLDLLGKFSFIDSKNKIYTIHGPLRKSLRYRLELDLKRRVKAFLKSKGHI